MEKVILSLGSSLGDKLKTLSSAVNDIDEKIGAVVQKSKIYESEPWGFKDENFFLNMAVELSTDLSPDEVLEQIISIENKYFRVRNTSNSYQARTLDIDIIFFGSLVYSSEKLTIPHKYAHKRLFVLLPVADISKDFVHPIFKKSINYLLEKCDDASKIVPLNEIK